MGVVSLSTPVYLGQFRIVRPRYETTQQAGCEWLTRAHIQAAAADFAKTKLQSEDQPETSQAAAQIAAGMSKRTDVVHNEMCTLHFDPSRHEPEQLVVQSLFADGHIAYGLNAEHGNFRVLELGEEIIPDSVSEMTWKLAPHAFQMCLGRAVPQLIATHVCDFVNRLYDVAGLRFDHDRARSAAALHPGSPRIIDGFKETLQFEESAVADSRAVLREMEICHRQRCRTYWNAWRETTLFPWELRC